MRKSIERQMYVKQGIMCSSFRATGLLQRRSRVPNAVSGIFLWNSFSTYDVSEVGRYKLGLDGDLPALRTGMSIAVRHICGKKPVRRNLVEKAKEHHVRCSASSRELGLLFHPVLGYPTFCYVEWHTLVTTW